MYYIGIDIGGTRIKYGLLNDRLQFIKKSTKDTQSQTGGNGILNQIFQIIEEYLEYNPKGIGVSTAGIVRNGSIYYANDNIKNYIGLNMQKEIEKKYKIPVRVYNDVNAAALGEKYVTGFQNFFFMAIGTGVGGGIIFNGKLIEGMGGIAGEIGYLPSVNGEKLDLSASNAALIKEAGMSSESLFRLAENGDQYARNLINEWCTHIAAAVLYIVGILNPEKIIIGGGVSAEEDYLKPVLAAKLKEMLPDPFFQSFELCFAKARNDAGIIGAVAGIKGEIE